MTAQAADHVLLAGVDYRIAGVEGSGLFVAEEHGPKPTMGSTANWRGHLCSYRVEDGRLMLTELMLSPTSELDGAPIHAGTVLFGARAATVASKVIRDWVFRDLSEPVPFTGGLLLGADFVPETYVHMGFHPAWRYRRVIELILADGVVRQRHDRSDDVQRLRQRIADGSHSDPDGQRGGADWVRRTFTLDYNRSLDR